jgi:hypothetical protein
MMPPFRAGNALDVPIAADPFSLPQRLDHQENAR